MIPKSFSLFLTVFLCSSSVLLAQSLTVSLTGNPDTTGLSLSEIQGLERDLQLSLTTAGSASDTLVVELGPSPGSYDLLTRRFPLNQTGTFDDGCSLTSSGGNLTIGLGSYTGLSTFYVRAYLSSAGVGTAVTASN